MKATFPHGVMFTDETCRRGEVRVHPDWQDEPSPPLDAAAARPILELMGAPTERRAVRERAS